MKAILGCCLLACAAGLWAGTDSVGTTAASFTKLGLGARPAAMGDAAVADSLDPSDIAFNPASLARSPVLSLQATHLEWFQGARMENVAGSFSLGSSGALGGAITYLGLPAQAGGAISGDVNDPNATLTDLGTFSPSDLGVTLGYGRHLSEHLDVGGTLKLTSESLGSSTAMGFTADLGFMAYLPGQPVVFGFSAQNLGPASSIASESFAQPLVIRAGARYNAMSDTAHGLKLLAEMDLPMDNAIAVAAGAELQLYESLFVRLGFRADGIFNSWTAGLGLAGTKEFSLDMAVVPAGDLGWTYRGTVTYAFAGVAAAAPSAVTVPLKVSLKVLTSPGATWQASATASQPAQLKRWGLYIYSGTRIIRQIKGAAPLPDPIVWDGKDDNGNPAAPGRYPLRLAALDAAGKAVYSAESASFVVSAEPQR
ncbi:MAG: PorV/PorQ family protein [candidate division FCPU426 bacterium]